MDEYYQAVRALPAWLASLLAQLPVQTAVRIQELRLRTGCAVTFTVQGRQCSASALPGCPPKLATIRLNALQIEEIFHTLCNGSVHTHERELAEGYLTTAVGNRVGVAGPFVQREGQCIALQKVTSLNLRIARSCVIPLPPALDKLLEQHFTGLLVVGEPGSGKTTVAVRLAKYLADKRRNVILLLCDMTAPMLPCICPAADLECERSLGSVLAAAHVSENLVKNNLVTHKRLGYLTMLGMLKGENEYTYPPYNEVQARELIDCLREIAPYVVIDCGSYIANDILSAVALMEADSVLRLANADLKSISYLSSQLPLLRDAKWDTDKQYKTASNVKSQQAGDHMSQALGTVAFTLPHSAELEGQYLAGNLLADLSMKDSRVFRKEIEKIAREVFGC